MRYWPVLLVLVQVLTSATNAEAGDSDDIAKVVNAELDAFFDRSDKGQDFFLDDARTYTSGEGDSRDFGMWDLWIDDVIVS